MGHVINQNFRRIISTNWWWFFNLIQCYKFIFSLSQFFNNHQHGEMICIRRYIDKPFLEWYFDKRGVDRNSRDGKFWARWRIKKDVFRVLIPHGDSEFFLCPTLVTTRKASFLKEVSVECNQNLNLSQLLQFDYLQKLSVLFVYLFPYRFTIWVTEQI